VSAKVGSFTASSSGAIAQDNPNRTQGSWDQTIGAGKEMVGGALGLEDLKQEGIKQNQAGKEMEARGQLSDLGSGVTDQYVVSSLKHLVLVLFSSVRVR
jgi:uncharacterized protein YjbJ (UPF0337 family)